MKCAWAGAGTLFLSWTTMVHHRALRYRRAREEGINQSIINRNKTAFFGFSIELLVAGTTRIVSDSARKRGKRSNIEVRFTGTREGVARRLSMSVEDFW